MRPRLGANEKIVSESRRSGIALGPDAGRRTREVGELRRGIARDVIELILGRAHRLEERWQAASRLARSIGLSRELPRPSGGDSFTPLVLDPSAASRLVLPPEPEVVEGAARLLEDVATGAVELISPALLTYDVGEYLGSAAQAGVVSVEEAGERLEDLLRLVDLFPLDLPHIRLALERSVSAGLSLRSGVYMAASISSGYPLITADGSVVEAAADIEVIHLRDYGG